MYSITVTTTAMGFRVGVNKKGEIKNTPINIFEYTRKFGHKTFDPVNRNWVLVGEYFHYDEINEVCYFPKYDLPEFIAFVKMHGCDIDVIELPPEKGEISKFLMLPFVDYKNDKQRKAVSFLTDPNEGSVRACALQTGAGKALSIDSVIRTPSGWVRNGDICLNDDIVTPDGNTCRVIGVYPQGLLDLYKVTFEDGRSTECCDDHLWKVHYIQWKDKWRVLPFKQIRLHIENNPTYKNRLYIPLPEPEIKDPVDLPIDPYILGVILGDGTIHKNSVVISKPDKFIKEEIDRLLPPDMKTSNWYGDGNMTYAIIIDKKYCIENKINPNKSRLMNIIRDLELSNKVSHTKFIPDSYINGSFEQKVSLLQGLMDTDGTVGKPKVGRNGTVKHNGSGSVQFCTTSLIMAKQIQELIRSIGGLCKISNKDAFFTYNGERRQGRLAYILNIRYSRSRELFKTPLKQIRLNHNQYQDVLKLRIKSIEYIGKKEAQCIEVDHPDHLYITDDYIVTHNTVSCIWSLQKLTRRPMITMTSRMEQWVSEFIKYTTLEEDDIYVIQGVGSLTKLFNQIDSLIKPKIILASTRTIRLYLEYGPTYRHLPHPSLMCEKLKIGVVGTDEYHENFYTNFLIGIILNPSLFIPITATFLANDPFVKNIFNQFIPQHVQVVGGEYDKYVNVTSYTYKSAGGFIKPFHYMSPQGYSQVKFEKYLLGRGIKVLDALMSDAIIPILKTHYISLADKGEKLLIICATTDMCNHFHRVLNRLFRDKTISVFYSGMSTTILEKFDVIISTPGSSGTGRDIKNLRTCFVFDNTGSEIRNEQYLGRLRGPPQMMNVPEFTYLSFACITQHQKYSTMRSMLYGNKALKLTHRDIS